MNSFQLPGIIVLVTRTMFACIELYYANYRNQNDQKSYVNTAMIRTIDTGAGRDENVVYSFIIVINLSVNFYLFSRRTLEL